MDILQTLPKVEQFENKNQFVIKWNDYELFQSYDSRIALKTWGVVYVDPDYCFYSNTTSRHFKMRVGERNFDAIKKHLQSWSIEPLTQWRTDFIFISLN